MLLIVNVVPPILHQARDPRRGEARISGHVLPGLGPINVRNRLEEVRRENLPADILDGVELLIDAEMRRVERTARRLQKTEMIVEIGAGVARPARTSGGWSCAGAGGSF